MLVADTDYEFVIRSVVEHVYAIYARRFRQKRLFSIDATLSPTCAKQHVCLERNGVAPVAKWRFWNHDRNRRRAVAVGTDNAFAFLGVASDIIRINRVVVTPHHRHSKHKQNPLHDTLVT